MTGAAHPLDLDGFVRREYARVVGAVGLITGDHEGAADAVQDALLRLIARPPVPAPRNVAAWVTVAASNRARDVRRRGLAERRAYERMGIPDRMPVDPAGLSGVDLVEAMRALPERQRQACVLHYLADEPVAAIAESMGVTAGTVKTQLHRARRSLARALEPPHEPVPLTAVVAA
jgi:RNA polymerase sigma factor (sigma-70 family)